MPNPPLSAQKARPPGQPCASHAEGHSSQMGEEQPQPLGTTHCATIWAAAQQPPQPQAPEGCQGLAGPQEGLRGWTLRAEIGPREGPCQPQALGRPESCLCAPGPPPHGAPGGPGRLSRGVRVSRRSCCR